MIVLMKSDREGWLKKKKKSKILVSVVNIINTTRNIITWMPVEKIQRFVI